MHTQFRPAPRVSLTLGDNLNFWEKPLFITPFPSSFRLETMFFQSRAFSFSNNFSKIFEGYNPPAHNPIVDPYTLTLYPQRAALEEAAYRALLLAPYLLTGTPRPPPQYSRFTSLSLFTGTPPLLLFELLHIYVEARNTFRGPQKRLD